MDPRFELWVSRRNKWDGGEWEKERGNETGLEHGSLRCERGKIGTRQKRSSTLFLLSGGDNRGKVMTIVRFELASPASAWQSIIRHGFYSFQWGRRHFQFGESYLSPSSLLLCAPLYPRLFFTQIHLSKNELFFSLLQSVNKKSSIASSHHCSTLSKSQPEQSWNMKHSLWKRRLLSGWCKK